MPDTVGLTTILLADDNEDSREIYSTFLEVQGFRVLTAADGATALRMCRKERPDLVVLNLLMPGMGGDEVLEAVRDDPELEDIRCILLTGDARPERMGAALVKGADGYLTKPAEPRRVLDTVRSLLAEG